MISKIIGGFVSPGRRISNKKSKSMLRMQMIFLFLQPPSSSPRRHSPAPWLQLNRFPSKGPYKLLKPTTSSPPRCLWKLSVRETPHILVDLR